jgi:hypothetical protein
VATDIHLDQYQPALRSEIQISEGILPKLGRGNPETKESKEGLIKRLDHLFRKYTLMMGRR